MEVKVKLRDNFVVFILTHGRPNKVKTFDTIRSSGYTGKIILLLDNEDDTVDEYRHKFSELNNTIVYVFDKLHIAETYDAVDLCDDRRTIFYARNACFEVAKSLGYRYFLELDDDYTLFRSRVNDNGKFSTIVHKDLDSLFEIFLQFLYDSGANTVALSQTGDFLGGMNSVVWRKQITRKAMNSFFCDTEKPFEFIGRINEDVNTYVSQGMKGKLFFTIAKASLDQICTQSNSGGMTDIYLECGTYVKSFFSVIVAPSCVKIAEMGQTHKRLHHLVNWENAVPKIISSSFKK